MRRARCLLVVLAVLAGPAVPGTAGAQSPFDPVPQDLSITGEIVAREGLKVRTVRFTVLNNGPGALDGRRLQVAPTALEAQILTASPGCGQTFPGYRCDLGTHLEPGEARSADLTYEYVGAAYRSTGVQGILVVSNDGLSSVGDANPANDRVVVDLDVERGPPAIGLRLGGFPAGAAHGAPVNTFALISNIGGTRLLDVRLISDRCPESAQRIDGGQTAELGIPGNVGISCTWTTPAHVKGDRGITETGTVTARTPDGRVVSAAATRTIGFREPERKCGSFRARRRTYDTRSTAPDIACARTRRILKRCRIRRKAPKGFRCFVSAKGSGVIVQRASGPSDRMVATARR